MHSTAATRNAIETAREVAAHIETAIAGKSPSELATTSASTLRMLEGLLSGLATELSVEKLLTTRLSVALTRIANCEIRGSANLIETKNWKRIVDEFQAIAETALLHKSP